MFRIISALLLVTASLACQQGWQCLSSKYGDLPVPLSGTQQTASLVADLDNSGVADFVITDRTGSPSVVWYRRSPHGWSRYIIENLRLSIEAGGTSWDIDGDGDLDLV